MKLHLRITLALCGLATVNAQVSEPNIVQYGLGKSHGFLQTTPEVVMPDSFTFSAFVDATTGGMINGGKIYGPLYGFFGVNGPQSLNLHARGANFESTIYLDQGSLDTAFPNDNSGNYVLKIDAGTAGGALSGGFDYAVSFMLGGDAYVADVPTLAINNGYWTGGNFMLDVNSPTAFGWTFSSYNAATDVVLFSIRPQGGGDSLVNLQFQGSNPGDYTVNAGFLTSGQLYEGRLTFARIVDNSTDVPGVMGLAFYAMETSFVIQAIPEPSTYVLLALGLGVAGWARCRWRLQIRGSGSHGLWLRA